MKNSNNRKSGLLFYALLAGLLLFGEVQTVKAQVSGPQEIKWMWVGQLRHWFSNGLAEIEYGRRGRACCENTDQIDGLIYPAQFANQNHNVAGVMWIGTTDYDDPVSNENYAHKVVCMGSRVLNLNTEIYPEKIEMIGRYDHPVVLVDNAPASDLDDRDEVDIIDPDMSEDRMVVIRTHTSIGITVTKKVRYFAQKNHENFYIYDYVFKNTGIIDNNGTVVQKDLKDVVFHWQHRLAFGHEAFVQGWAYSNQNYGRNAVNDVIGENGLTDGSEFRASINWFGPHSGSGNFLRDIGQPNPTNSKMVSAQYVGIAVLHADTDVDNKADDIFQPKTTKFMGSDRDDQGVNQYNADLMSRKYTKHMTAGHLPQSHAELIGESFADDYGDDNGGYSAAQGFGPYPLMKHGDSIRIVLVEAIGSLDIITNKQVTVNWANNENLILPNGSEASSADEYKRTWVETGKDSLYKAFRNAKRIFNEIETSGVISDPAPPAPTSFSVIGGGDRIQLKWTPPETAFSNFAGYRVYRGVDRPDTTFQLIYDGTETSYDDKSAKRGVDYYYYVVTYDDGSTNTDVTNSGTPLESSMFYTLTNQPATLKRPPGKKLSEIRVVPNPYNIRAQELQFGTTTQDRIAFYGLPANCKIKIFTERGDLVNTIIHDDGSGDETWEQLTSSRQLVVSGVYIAYFEVMQDIIDQNSGSISLKKGDNIFRRFVIIR
ncbi:MAG: hypothetical protein D8M58_05175 [Calditrichaeota bacterium]|nr:MAG: hypothetical protein DWQ03_01900 [Calditrichota bacterium]MBL1204766.1 hypothetical protein [Calditrichota bacterium]NOG44594.1 fibronectin type III domain-containing protein [Calditrichota bacterium]